MTDLDHGDDFDAWCGDIGSAAAVRRGEEEWATVAGYVRHAANKLGPALPLCLPGEPQECGRSAQQHVLAWGAVLKARAQDVIDQAAPAPGYAAFAGGTLYQRHRAFLGDRTSP
ncbi:hypothetical protein NX801_26165 [Streptomyces sp. LP05-1]|uniref:Uncharacterized protein n=1 Tax=Streptomyces pyxinae TaxID=2970734 RepID=A0ABT2CNQ8_9ACTN|nr:hypothetical protein [Streptomyces sp. LP05-1]MCS0639065.1 hypothetical protein [Streptomyces sp. LP05-1]